MKLNFFPRNKTFWVCHGSVLLLLTLVQTTIIVLWRDSVTFNMVAGLLWLPLFTLAALYYRYQYKKGQWQERGTISNIFSVTLYSFVAGILVATVMLGVTMPFFWDEVLKHGDIQSGKSSVTEVIFQHVIGNGLQTQIFIAGWIFIYISIISRQRIKETEITNLRLQNSLRDLQLSNLTNQLNPHFLFNALNNIRFTIHEDPQKADHMITALSDILRYSLDGSRQEKVLLSAELDILQKYISIMKIQMEQRLEFSLEVDESLQSYLIPPMVLQLLVENAIKHGIDNLPQGGKVLVQALQEHEELLFTITNEQPPGVRLPSSAQQSQGSAGQPLSFGIGLKNIEQRLQLLYSNQASFNTQQENGLFTVLLRIPCERR